MAPDICKQSNGGCNKGSGLIAVYKKTSCEIYIISEWLVVALQTTKLRKFYRFEKHEQHQAELLVDLRVDDGGGACDLLRSFEFAQPAYV